MRKLANHGQAILCTIHQPSAILMQEFDRLLFLARGGQTIYFGDLGKNSQTLIDYFEKYGAPKCPPQANPAEWMLHVIGAAPGSHANQDYHEVWLNSSERQDVKRELEEMERELVKVPMENTIKSSFAAPLWLQYVVVTTRVFQQYWRSPSFVWSKLFLSISSCLFIGFALFNAKLTMQGLQNQMFSLFMFLIILNPLVQQLLPYFVKQRDLYETRERPSKTFSWFAFMAAQITVEIPWNALNGTIGFFTFYYPVGFYHNAQPTDKVNARGAYAWIASIAFFIYAGTLGHLVIAPLELAESAGNLATLMFALTLGFCGVLVTLEELPGFWKFMYYMSPFTYYVDGFLSNAVANTDVTCAQNEYVVVAPPGGETCGDYLDLYLTKRGTGYLVDENSTTRCELCPLSTTNAFLHTVNIDYNKRWRNFGILICYIAFNISGALFLYWLVRVPKKNDRVKKDRPEAKSIAHDNEADLSKDSNSEKTPSQ
jgi:ATP-binding cassette subfamily G (WHITE) protein 2 (PDR)